MTRHGGLALVLLLLALGSAGADERLEGIACRSVHLNYPAPEGTAFYNEATVARSAPGTYFCVCGFGHGYYGLQELGNGKKLLIFSVWDPGQQDDPRGVAEEKRVRLLAKDDKVRVGRFGGEGTGGQSFYDFDWKVGETYRFLVRARPDGERTAYAAYFYHPEKNAWMRLAVFSTPAGGRLLNGYYSFVEDFRRDRVSATQAREAAYGNGWVRSREGTWMALTRAKFTADANPVKTINAGLDGAKFVLTTGGQTRNSGTPLGGTLDRPPTGVVLPPED